MLGDIDYKRGLPDLWPMMDDAQRAAVIDKSIIQNYRRNEIIYRIGDEPQYLICVLSGRVKLEKLGVGGRMQILRMFRPGDSFGYRSAFAGQHHLTEAVAMDAAQLALVPMELIKLFCTINNKIAMYFIKALASDLGNSEERAVNLTQKHVRGRLAEAIVLIAERYGYEPDEQTLAANVSRDDLASLANMTTSNAIRTLSQFVDDKMISLDGRKIIIQNHALLKHVSKNG